MSQMVWISDEAYGYVKKIQAKLYEDKGIKTPMGKLVSEAILCNIKDEVC